MLLITEYFSGPGTAIGVSVPVRKAQPRRNVCWSRASVCLSVCLSIAAFPHCCTDPGVTWRNDRGVLLEGWGDLQSVHGFRCCDNIARTQNVSECLYSLYAWFKIVFIHSWTFNLKRINWHTLITPLNSSCSDFYKNTIPPDYKCLKISAYTV